MRSRSHRLLSCVAATLAAAVLLCQPLVSSAAYYLHSAYDHDSADPAWLNDLVIKESVGNVSDMTSHAVLTAAPSYPYTETPDSFMTKVNYYVDLYTLDDSTQKAAYIYLFQQLNKFATVETGDVTDAEVRQYLISQGFVYPASEDEDTAIIARALYIAKVNGVADKYATFYDGEPIQKALVDFSSGVLGIDLSSLSKYMPGGGAVSTLNDLVIATSKASLYLKGYDVSADMSDAEVYRDVAIMVTETAGFTADSGMTAEQLKLRYLAAMMDITFDVNMDCDKLSQALDNDRVAFYVLQLIGKKAGVTIRDSLSYNEAFQLAAESSDIFKFDAGDFWSDVFDYKASFAYKRSSCWVCATCASNSSNDAGCTVTVTANGNVIPDATYTEVPLDTSYSTQTLKIVVSYSKGSVSSQCTYTVLITQGDTECSESSTSAASSASASGSSGLGADSVINSIISSAGLSSTSVTDFIGSLGFSLPTRVSGITDLLVPSFTGSSDTSGTSANSVSAATLAAFSALDKAGSSVNSQLSGVGGYKAFVGIADLKQKLDNMLGVTFNK